MPKNFTRWVKDNEERIAGASSLPYFLADNGKVSNGKFRYYDLMLTANVVQPAIWDSVMYLDGINRGAVADQAARTNSHLPT